MAFNLRGNTPPPSSVGTTELADAAVTTPKIAADAVTIDKVSTAIGTEGFFGSEATFTHTGDTVITAVAEFNFIKNSTDEANWKKTSYQVKLNNSDGIATATFQLFIDTVLQGSGVTTTSASAVVLEETSLDISALADGSHLVELKVQTSDAAETTTLSHFELFLAKK